MTGYYKLYGSHGCGRRHLIYMHHKRLVHAIETCGILCSQIMAIFADYLGFLNFHLNINYISQHSSCTYVAPCNNYSRIYTRIPYLPNTKYACAHNSVHVFR